MMPMAFALERLFGNNNQPGKVVWLIDFKGFALKDCNPRMGLAAIPMFANHYPERMAQICLFDPPAIFNAMYRAVYPVVDPVTRTKIVFLRGATAFRDYADRKWRQDPAMYDWLQTIRSLPGVPGSFPDAARARNLNIAESAEALDSCHQLHQRGAEVPPGALDRRNRRVQAK